MALHWIKKYDPKEEKDIIGQDNAIRALDNFISGFSKQKKKAVFLHGPSGSGKTCSAYAVGSKYNFEIVEVNASDFRNKEQINLKLGSALKQQSLFAKGKIILVDEIDGLSGTKDRGGIAEITKLIENPAFPVILTVSDPWNKKFSKVRTKSSLIEFKEREYTDVFKILKGICEKENIKFDETALKGLSRRCGGDLRAAINDLQSLVEGKKSLTREDLDFLTERNRIETMPNALIRVLKNSDPIIALGAFDNVREDFDEQFLWIDENMPKEYTNPRDLARAYDAISKADVFKGRIRRWQHWRFLVYVNSLLTAGVAAAKSQKYPGMTKYTPTTRIFKLWRAKMKNMKKKAIAGKIAQRTHTSTKRALQDTLPYLKEIFKNSKTAGNVLADELELEKEEVEWLRKN